MHTPAKKEIKRQSRKGFTLIELLIVVSILAVLGGIAVANFMGQAENANFVATRTSIANIKKAVDAFRLEVKRLPKSMEELSTPINDGEPLLDPGAHNDAWGNPIEYKLEGKRYTLTSAGPDGIMGTEDDLTN